MKVYLSGPATYGNAITEIINDLNGEYRQMDAHLARIEAAGDRAKAAEAHQFAIAALTGLRTIARSLDADVAIRNARGVA